MRWHKADRVMHAVSIPAEFSIHRRMMLAGAATSLAMVACRGASAATEKLTVRIGFASVGAENRPFTGGSSAAIVHAERYLENEFKDTPDLKIEWSFFKGAGPAVNEAFANGQLDFALQGDLPAVIGRANGLKTKILAATGAHAPMYLAVTKGSPIRRVEDLRGKRVSIFRGTNNHLAAVKVLAAYGLQEKDLQVINMDTATTSAALIAGDIDAAFGNFPLSALAERGLAEIVYSTKGDKRSFERHSMLIGWAPFVDKHPEVTQRIVTAIVRAARWASDEANRDAVFEIWAKSGFPASTYRFDFDGQKLQYRASPLIDDFIVEQYRFQARQAKEHGLVRRDVDITGWFDRKFLDRSLVQLELTDYWTEFDAQGQAVAAKAEKRSDVR